MDQPNSAYRPRARMPESMVFAFILLILVAVIYIMAVGLQETFYGRWRVPGNRVCEDY